MDIDLANVFKNIGFDEKEAKAYLALLTIGRGTVTEIAKHSGLKRAIVYHVLERLKKRGYAQELREGKIKNFSASDPARVLQNASAAAESLRMVLPMIQALQDKGREKPRIEFFEGEEAVVSVYRMYSTAKNVRYLSSMKRLFEIIPDEVVRWSERLRSGRVKSTEKNLLNDSKEDRDWAKMVEKAGLRSAGKASQQARILPKGIKMEMDFTIADDVLGITSFDPFYIVVIHSPAIARSAAQLFDLAWLQGKKV
ncbi:MAG: hypothetical protein FJZ04_04125 [Candidatus Moranbacteria bacterium]|nr:hypothetical protein [Candidatus Moranbacteria bacterium]